MAVAVVARKQVSAIRCLLMGARVSRLGMRCGMGCLLYEALVGGVRLHMMVGLLAGIKQRALFAAKGHRRVLKSQSN